MINSLDRIVTRHGMRFACTVFGVLLIALVVLAGCKSGTESHRGAPARTTSTHGSSSLTLSPSAEALQAQLKAVRQWSSAKAYRYGTPDTHNAGWFANIPATQIDCGYETRGAVGPFCTIENGDYLPSDALVDVGAVDGHKQCASLVGDPSYIFCYDGYRTITS